MPDPAPIPVDDGTLLTKRAWKFLERELKQLGTPLPEPVVPVLEFRAAADKKPTTLAQRRLILDQAEVLFRDLYVHLPFKLEEFRFSPPKRFLDATRRKLARLGNRMTETEFHSWMIAAFSLVRDAHTLYGLPSPYRGAVAFLPFQMRCVTDSAGQRRYFVTRVMRASRQGGFGHPFFAPGAEILKLAGCPIDNHIQRAAGRLPAANDSAVFSRGAIHCTTRPLKFVQFPFPEEMPAVEVEYKGLAGGVHAISLPWGVARFPDGAAFPSAAFSMSMLSGDLACFNHCIHYRQDLWEQKRLAKSKNFHVVSTLPEIFEFQYTGGKRQTHPIPLDALVDPQRPRARFGYIRIKAFANGATPADTIVNEFARILELMDAVAPDGLILDIRGNPGGDIQAAERMLQMLGPGRIDPVNFHLRATPAILRVLRNLRRLAKAKRRSASVATALAEFESWLADAGRQSSKQPGRLTSGHPLTGLEDINDTGQIYQGPVVLLIDGLTYSAADIFAAGFQDHRLGLVIGIDATTGGGGANVWRHEDLAANLGPSPGLSVARLPRDVTMSLAIRRCSRVGINAGLPIEDLGVRADVHHQPETIDDVIANYPSLITLACSTLGSQPRFRIDVQRFHLRQDGAVVAHLRAENMQLLRFFLDGQPAGETRITRPRQSKTVLVKPVVPDAATLRIEGLSKLLDHKELVLTAVRNVTLREAAEDADAPVPSFDLDPVTGMPKSA